MSLLSSVSSFLSSKKASLNSRGFRQQVISAVKSLSSDSTRWTRICTHSGALKKVFSAMQHRDPFPDSQLFMESLLEAVRVLLAKHREKIMRLRDKEADAFMCLLQALLDFIPRQSVYRSSLLNALIALAVKSQSIPESLVIQGVTDQTKHVVAVGGFGDIKRAMWKGKMVALKTPRYSSHLSDHEKSYRRLCREVLLWRQLRHPHLLELFGILHTKEKVLFPTMVAPWMEHGTVLQYVRNYPQVSKLTLLNQVARALNYLHRHDPPIVHQDIRCANILVNGFCEAVLSDFGLSRVNDGAFQNIMSSLQDGCTRWQAPEMVFPTPANIFPSFVDSSSKDATDSKSRHASRKTDIWSFGMVILELFTEAIPFSHIAHDAAVVIDLYHGALPRRPEPHEIRGLNSEIADFDVIWNIIEQCWTKAPRERPSASLLVREIGKEVEARKREEEKIRMGTTITDSGYQGSPLIIPRRRSRSPTLERRFRCISLTSERLRCDEIIEERRRSYSAESRFPDVFEDPIPSPVGPFTSADSAAMAEAFRKALWKPDFHSLSTYDLETIPDSEGKDRASETYSERPESIRRNGSHVQPASMIGERAGDLSSPTAVEGLISDRRNSSSPVTEIRAPTRATNDDTPPESPLPIFHSIHGTGDHHADYVYQICDPPPGRYPPLSPEILKERSAPISRLTSPVLSDDDSELSAYPGDRIPSLRAKQSQSSISLSVQDDSVLEGHGRWDSKTSEGLRRRDSGTSEMLRRWESMTSESSTSAAIQIISRSPLTVPTASSSFDDLSPSSLSEQVHHISTQRSRNSSLSSMPGNVSVNPRAAFRPYITISPYCYTSMFLSSPDSVAALERLHSVHVSFRKSRSSGSKVDLFISANTSGNEEAAMPDILSAQWEIEKVVEFYNIFGTHMRTPSAPEA